MMLKSIKSSSGESAPAPKVDIAVPTDALSIQEESSQEIMHDGGYGWVCVFAVFMLNAHTWGISTSYSVFLAHYRQASTLQGASSLHYAFVGGLQFSQAFMISPLATKVMGRFGPRVCLLAGVVLQTSSLLGASFATHIWHLYLEQALGFGWGVGFILIASQNVVPQWFHRRRGLATGLAAVGTGAGGLLYAMVAGQMIQQMGVGWAIRVLAIVSGVVNTACSITVRTRDKVIHPKYSLFNFDLFRQRRYLLLLGFSFFSMLGEIVILTQIPDYGAVVLELEGTQIFVIGAMVALGQILGRSSIGFASDHVGHLNIAALVTFLAGLWSLAVWIPASSYGLLIFFSLFIGAFAAFFSGAFWSIIAPVTAEVMTLQLLPDSLSMMFLFLVLPTTFSPVIGMTLVTTADGSYLGTQVFAGCSFIVAATFCWALRMSKVGRDPIIVPTLG
ncbi:hypothetical protein BHE90_011850 [Fusarium euwallaceae]|uniref:Major facilitator superfamily (MFS) profile domain-containing protein n=1 Tax=Fusarium euwallaceae TaxID=1147111 RepID=A0A430LDB7_9HYPO|nr:hypothetical protein BHE90_011850 [Fusarium euwallaceae]